MESGVSDTKQLFLALSQSEAYHKAEKLNHLIMKNKKKTKKRLKK